MDEVRGDVPIGAGDNELAKIDVWTKWRGWRCKRMSPRMPSIWPCCIVECEEEGSEIDSNIEVEVRA